MNEYKFMEWPKMEKKLSVKAHLCSVLFCSLILLNKSTQIYLNYGDNMKFTKR